MPNVCCNGLVTELSDRNILPIMKLPKLPIANLFLSKYLQGIRLQGIHTRSYNEKPLSLGLKTPTT